MHLLAAAPGQVTDGSEAVDLGQSPADIVFLSAADSEIACLAAAQALRLAETPGAPSLRLANLMHLAHNMSVDLYAEQVLDRAKLIFVRVLGGRGYWSYGVDQLVALAHRRAIPLALLPGDDQPDPDLTGLSTLDGAACHRIWQYGVHGGTDNAVNLLRYAATLLGGEAPWREPAPLLRAGIYWPGKERPGLEDLPVPGRSGTAAIVFYRALVQGANTAAIDSLIAALAERGMAALPVYVTSLKDPVAAATLEALFGDRPPSVVLNGTGFAVSTPGGPRAETPFDSAGCPVLQIVFSGGDRDGWHAGQNGLGPRDIAMNVALPEVDGRVITRAVSFKSARQRDPHTQADIVVYRPEPGRCVFVAELAARWARLAGTPPADRRIAVVLANYPNRDGRLGNGVGLDTPAGTVKVLAALGRAGYRVQDMPADGAELVRRLLAGPTNAAVEGRTVTETLGLDVYRAFFSDLPQTVRRAVEARWGLPEEDPFYLDSRSGFAISAFRCGHVAVGLQPARGYNIDPQASYHDPDLVPPHGYLAFYCWLRRTFDAHAVVHMGKHGNLEWLPGKALALSEACYPEAAFGPMPHLYPFIVNDPGEGTQAKRRSQAVIVDHLTPPLSRAETYGPLKDLEQLVDEYYEAAGLDPRRLSVLRREILSLAATIGLDRDCGIDVGDAPDAALGKLDNYLCELKELQIRDGLHVFGATPADAQLTDLLVALARVPRGVGEGADASLIRALAQDMGLDFDPLSAVLGDAWDGPRPDLLAARCADAWRSTGDTVERLELLARALVAGEIAPTGAMTRTAAVLEEVQGVMRPAVLACGPAELEGLLTGLDGRFVEPGPSGAPTRGRPEVLPTGRNFFSVDTRTVPTPAAWTLGWKSAGLIMEHYAQTHGDWPRRLVISAWGTANMRTGGDDVAQALALMGVRPTWDPASRRVTGFEVLPLSVLDRPRVDVTFRISGFFRDAFPGLVALVDSAARAVAALDEAPRDNPLAAAVTEETERLVGDGADPVVAARRSGGRVFGAKPGAYGAGLQALIDERGWEDDRDLARAYVAWGGYLYAGGVEGEAAHAAFERRLSRVDAVVQNQDNREHDLLDSDDYYQFEGGAAAAVRALSGAQPALYHNDHSRPESPRVRTLDEEIARVVRGRAANPKWIRGVMRHGYKGAFEIAATVDYLFAFAATARCVADHHFEALFDAYLRDATVRDFMSEVNPAARDEVAARFREAIAHGLWQPRANDVQTILDEPADRAAARPDSAMIGS